jgi:hypothetical protein
VNVGSADDERNARYEQERARFAHRIRNAEEITEDEGNAAEPPSDSFVDYRV